ncbi:FlgO family outer membrane protein [Ramlibacter sp. H39-3-26]|uniref:FlgO family outer membrane protein n=1 Tax=Curvibacter soli TaxID=3031331 RepID=UPI0023DB6BEF|nr:FlgO family outer membrane protein [Ramlibacter sp. H39-3-26]MDF1485053.1 FlgO family outer membrane protein [Ramlibacter sp. H39-3-26]
MPHPRILPVALALALAFMGAGCAQYYYGGGTLLRPDPIALNYEAADRLMASALLDPGRPLLVATLVHVDQLSQSSRLGRIFSEQLASRLTQRGMLVRELKLHGSVLAKSDEGELMLSREAQNLGQSQDAQAVLVGTYAPTANTVYVNAKLVNPVTGTVLAAVDYAVPIDADMRGLLQRYGG